MKNVLLLKKKNYEYIDWFKRYLIIINNRKEFYIANEYEKEKNSKNSKTKKEMEDKDIEL